MEELNDVEININDTMPFFEINKISKNVFEFVYPEYEETKTEDSKFLYYPIEKNYVKINLEYPKNIEKIKIIGDNLEEVEVYVNTVDEEYGYDINEATDILTPCKKKWNNTYEVNEKITSVNISAVFKNDNNRRIRVEFIEE